MNIFKRGFCFGSLAGLVLLAGCTAPYSAPSAQTQVSGPTSFDGLPEGDSVELKEETQRFLTACRESGRQKKMAGWSETRLKKEQQEHLEQAISVVRRSEVTASDSVAAGNRMAERGRLCNQAESEAFRSSSFLRAPSLK